MVKNAYQAKSSEKKLRGEVFTPDWFARVVVERAQSYATGRGLGGVVVDPACGDGVFLEASLRARWARPELRSKGVDGLFGFDLDPGNVEKTRVKLAAVCSELCVEGRVTVEVGDALAPAGLMGGLLGSSALSAMRQGVGPFANGIDLVVGNPPYVDSKRLSDSEKVDLRTWFPDAAGGAADLCVYFVHHFVNTLAPGGRLAFIVPNKLLIAKFSERLRQRMVGGRLLHELIFVSHLDVFAKTAVYPVVIVLGNEPAERLAIHRPATTQELRKNTGQRRDVLHGLYGVTEPKCIFPLPSQAPEAALLEKLCSQAGERVRDVLDIRWTISFHATGLRDRYVFEGKPDSPFAMPFVGGARFSGNAEVQRYSATWGGTWIDYDEDRARKDKNPLPPRTLFEGGVVPICQNALRLRAAWSENNWTFKDTFLLGIPKARVGPLLPAHPVVPEHPLIQHPRAIVALLNSDLAHFFYANVFYASHINGGYLHYLAPYVGDIPLGNWDVAMAKRADGLVRKLEHAPNDQALDAEVQDIVATVFGMSAEESVVVANFARPAGRAQRVLTRSDRASRRTAFSQRSPAEGACRDKRPTTGEAGEAPGKRGDGR